VAELSRTPDFLRAHRDVGRRVRNLETGVHTTTANVDYFDSVIWTSLTILPSSGYSAQRDGLIADNPPMWRKRVGIVSMRGGVDAYDPAMPPDGRLLFQFPAAARPDVTMRFQVQIRAAPYVTTLEVRANGEARLFKDGWDGERADIMFDGVTWVPTDG
jgi:hypothetical protein